MSEKVKVEGGTKPVSIISIDDASKYWTLAAVQIQNIKAMALLVSSQAESIERRATDSECGMSQTGLARFCGISHQAIGTLLINIAAGKVASKYLEPFAGQDLYLQLDGYDWGKHDFKIAESLCWTEFVLWVCPTSKRSVFLRMSNPSQPSYIDYIRGESPPLTTD